MVSITSVWSSNNIADQSQYETITGSWTGGTSAFTANFYVTNTVNGNVIANSLSSATSPATFTFQVPQTNNALGAPQIKFTVSDSVSVSASTTNTFGVNSLLVASAPTASNTVIDNGQYSTFTAHPSGGTTAYSYLWYSGSSATCSSDTSTGVTTSTYTTQPSSSSTYYCYRLTDSASTNNVVYSSGLQITVNPVIQIAAKPSSIVTTEVGTSIPVNTLATGGTGSFTYAYTSSGTACAGFSSGSTNTLSFTPTVSGTCTFTFTANDVYTSNSAATATITVNPIIQITAKPSSTVTIDVGQSVPANALATGGTGSFTYAYTSSGTACTGFSSGSTNTISFTPTVSGTCTFTFIANDIYTSNSASPATIIVNSALVASSSPTTSNSVIDNGQYATLTVAAPTTGTSPYTYVWYSGTSPTCTSDTSTGLTGLSQTFTPSSSTYYCVQETDNTGSAVYTSTTQVQVNSVLVASAAPIASNTVINNGQYATLTINAPTTGTSPYIYVWYSGTSPTCTSDTSTGFTGLSHTFPLLHLHTTV